jgi:hypothetical protein
MIINQSRCRNVECRAKPNKLRGYFCSTHEDQVIDHAKQMIRDVLKKSFRVYVGRSYYPEKRAIEHMAKRGLPNLTVLHWAGDRSEADFFEQRLIDFTNNHLGDESHRCENKKYTGGEGRFWGDFQAIYIAWEPNESAVNPQHVLEVQRFWPRPWPHIAQGGVQEAHIAMTREEACVFVREYKERRKASNEDGRKKSDKRKSKKDAG